MTAIMGPELWAPAVVALAAALVISRAHWRNHQRRRARRPARR